MAAYYNEHDIYAAQWLRNLISAGHIAPGVVDERSIEDVTPADLAGFTQCHFFAGVGVWSLALRKAGWPDDRPVWTGSCPCQPFSAAGAGAGFADPRHLWPSFAWLIGQCKPTVVFGEQVASKAVEPWVDLVHADMEALGYAFGAVPFPSAGVGAPHIRDRLFWVADTQGARGRTNLGTVRSSTTERVRETQGQDLRRPGEQAGRFSDSSATGGMADTHGRNASAEWQQCGGEQRQQPQDGSGLLGLAYSRSSGSQEQRWGRLESEGSAEAGNTMRAGPVNGFWRAADWIGCRDDRFRPVEPGTFPLANGATSRVGRLRAYGNAINAEAAREFIAAYLA